MNEELLITLVQSYKELYDLQDFSHYDDQQRRDNIWKEIGDVIKESAATCRDKWRRIRDNYRRAKKLRQTKSGQAATNMRKPKYEDLLSFLNPYFCNEDETLSNIPRINVFQDSNNEDSHLFEDSHSRDSPGSSAGTSRSDTTNRDSSGDSTHRPYKRNCRSVGTLPQLSPTHLLLQEYLEKKLSAKNNKSEKIVDFFMNLGETVSNFPEDVQIRVKRDVFKIVSDAEEMVCKDKSNYQHVLESTQKNQPPVIFSNSIDYVQSPKQQTSQTFENFANPNNIYSEEENVLDLDDNALNAFINSVQQKKDVCE